MRLLLLLLRRRRQLQMMLQLLKPRLKQHSMLVVLDLGILVYQALA
jgi:hypothetical protein